MLRRSVLALCCAFTLLPLAQAAAAPTHYDLDTFHSDIGFKIRHMGITWVRGSFTGYSGTIVFDPADPEATLVDVVIDAASIDTNEATRDEHLRGAEFFDTATYPEIIFHSTRVENFEGDAFDLVGNLTIRDVTREVVLEVRDLTDEVWDGYGGHRRGATASIELDRKEFGVSFNTVLDNGGLAMGETVYVTLEIQMLWEDPKPEEAATASG